jgi:hypothetical protein
MMTVYRIALVVATMVHERRFSRNERIAPTKRGEPGRFAPDVRSAPQNI